jgi:hypothetical protein
MTPPTANPISPDADEEGVAQRDLAGEAGEQVEADGADGVDAAQGQHPQAGVAQVGGQPQEQQGAADHQGPAPRLLAGTAQQLDLVGVRQRQLRRRAGAGPERVQERGDRGHQTRRTSFVPNSP